MLQLLWNFVPDSLYRGFNELTLERLSAAQSRGSIIAYNESMPVV